MAVLAFSIPCTLVLFAIGVRVWVRARAAGASTDALVGVYFMAMGLGGIPALLSNNGEIFSRDVAPYAMAFGHALLSIGFGSLFIFVWRCFGSRSMWRMATALTGCASLALLYLAQGVLEGFEPPGGDIVRVTAVVRGSAVGWAFSEALNYWVLMRRRVQLGLADPVVANRFLLWCLWMGGMTSTTFIAISVRFFMPAFGPAATPATKSIVIGPVLGLCALAAASLWLAFFPPDWYVARLRRGAEAAQA